MTGGRPGDDRPAPFWANVSELLEGRAEAAAAAGPGVIFGIDASSAQGNVNWAATDKVTAFGAEKVTEGTNYVNPFWPAAKAFMTLRARSDGFLPIAYLFLDAGSGTAAADWFAQHAGNLDSFGIAVDLERAPNGSPTLAEARDCVARLRHHYPRHPVGIYAPHWYTGNGDITFADWLWASNYVTASGQSPAALYGHVAGSQWAAYGGEPVTLLQFTDAAIVPGAAGRVDCSAYRGIAGQLRQIILPRTSPPAAAVQKEEPMLLNKGAGAMTPIAIPKGATGLRFVAAGDALLHVEFHGHGAREVRLTWAAGSHRLAAPQGVHAARISRGDSGTGDVSVAVE